MTLDQGPPLPDTAGYRAFGHLADGVVRMMKVTAKRRPEVREVDRRILVRVAAVTTEAEDVVSLDLVPTERPSLPGWAPGAHMDVLLPSGRTRQYSLTGDPRDRSRYRIAVRRIADGDGGSREVHDLEVGQELVLKGPRNAFPFIVAPSYLFVAGGIGVTPILPMVRYAAARGEDWRFVYAGRDRASLPFLTEVEALAERFPDRVEIWPDDERGLPDAAAIVERAPEGAALYCCGPPAMIDALRAEVPAENVEALHSERFSAPPVVGGEAFTVELTSTGETFEVAADQTLLTRLLQVRPDAAYSCRQGFCGTCAVRYADGEVEHRDRFLPPEHRADRMAACVSRASGTLRLEL
ncbi:PDR/VanB family oxidoreductase [Nocardioides sp. LML1-1-1.1]|uniref:PDR/VanB family oxidoreductase n=1 Tax=Nocardioides sp. LML1-1-1.1 TaxID=3135248 RepID=UPI0034406CDE